MHDAVPRFPPGRSWHPVRSSGAAFQAPPVAEPRADSAPEFERRTRIRRCLPPRRPASVALQAPLEDSGSESWHTSSVHYTKRKLTEHGWWAGEKKTPSHVLRRAGSGVGSAHAEHGGKSPAGRTGAVDSDMYCPLHVVSRVILAAGGPRNSRRSSCRPPCSGKSHNHVTLNARRPQNSSNLNGVHACRPTTRSAKAWLAAGGRSAIAIQGPGSKPSVSGLAFLICGRFKDELAEGRRVELSVRVATAEWFG